MRERTADVSEQDGNEYELVLGNKQLLSILFLVVLLFGVFFAMGYVMGRNSAPIDAEAEKNDGDRSSLVPSSGRPSAAADSSEPVEIESERGAAADSAEPAQAPPSDPETPVAESAMTAPLLVTEPQPGQRFLQVSAVAKPEAELLVEVLTRKNFNALVAPGPNDRLFRVLVGPVRDEEHSVKMRSDLEAAGFKPIPRQY